MLVVSGQVKRETLVRSHDNSALRQLGDQEVDIVAMAGGIRGTRNAWSTRHESATRRKALYLATSGRPGPTWLMFQSMFSRHRSIRTRWKGFDRYVHAIRDVMMGFWQRNAGNCRPPAAAKRPVILVGTGVRLAGALALFEQMVARLGVPVAPAWTAIDQVPSDSEFYCGRTGTIGDRAGNFAVQNADVLLVIGSRLNIRQVSYNWSSFARHAFKIQVDVDAAELSKPTVRPDMAVHCDAGLFLAEFTRQLNETAFDADQHASWLSGAGCGLGAIPPFYRDIAS